MERLWSPWRHAYVTRKVEPDRCVFCAAAEAAPDAGSLVVHSGRHCFVVLNLYPYSGGHVMVVPRRHIATLTGLTDVELIEIARVSRLSESALRTCYDPQGINVGVNLGRTAGAGVVDHLHVHLVPRWEGDTNFMPIVGNVRVLPEDLATSAARLRPIFARLASDDPLLEGPA